jgi:hypothetical protein
MLIINRRIIDSCFFKFERRLRHNTKIENHKFFLHVFIENFFYIKKKRKKKRKELLANGYKNSLWPTAIILAISTVKCGNGC